MSWIVRIKALLRRTSYGDSEVLKSGRISIDLRSMRVLIDDKEVHFGPKEFKLLEHFIVNDGRVFSRSQLLDQVWGRSVYVEERTVDVHIRRLRSSLEQYGLSELIQTVRGSGYRFSHTETIELEFIFLTWPEVFRRVNKRSFECIEGWRHSH